MYAAGTIVFAIMLSICYEVIMRYFFNRPTAWAVDFAGYMQYALVLMGSAWVLKIDGHPRIDIIVSRTSAKTQAIMRVITSSVAVVTCTIFFWKGLEATVDAFQRGDFLYRNVEVPIGPLYAIIPFAFLLIGIEFGRQVYEQGHTFQVSKGGELVDESSD